MKRRAAALLKKNCLLGNRHSSGWGRIIERILRNKFFLLSCVFGLVLATGSCISEKTGFEFKPDQQKALTALMEPQSQPPKEPILRLETGMHSAALWKIDSDAANRYLVTGSNDKTVRIWDLSSYRLVKTLRPPIGSGREGEIRAVAISPDGETIACGGMTGKQWDASFCIYIFNRRTGQITGRLTGIPGSIHHLSFSKDGRFLAAGFWKGLRVYGVPGYSLIGHDNNYGRRCSGADFDHHGRLVTSSYDGFIRLYEVTETGIRCIAKKEAISGTHLFSIDFSPDGNKIATGYLDAANIDVFSGNNLDYLYSPDTAGIKRSLEPVAWSADGRSIYAGGYPRSIENSNRAPIFRWSEGGKGKRAFLPAERLPIQDVCPLKNGGIVFASYNTAWGIFDRWDTKVFHQKPVLADYRGQPKGFPISPDAGRVIFSFKPGFRSPALFDIQEGRVDLFLEPQPNLIWPKSNFSGLTITDWRQGATPRLNGKKLQLRENEISFCVAIAPDGKSFLLGTGWNLYRFDPNGKMIWKIPVASIVFGVNISQDSRVAVTTIGDGTIRWYRMEDGKEILAFFPHRDLKRWVAWTPEGYYMSSPYGDTLIGWHLNQGKMREAEFYTAMQFERLLYRPDYVRSYFEHLGDADQVSYLFKGKKFDIKNLASIAPPKIKILDPVEGDMVSSENIRLNISGEKRSLPMENLTVFVNNIPVTPHVDRILVGAEKDAFVREIDIPLFDRENRIRVEVLNGVSMGVLETFALRDVSQGTSIKGDLYLLSIGVNTFENMHENDLEYAAYDAGEFARCLKKETGDLFDRIFAKIISDQSNIKPSKENIIKNLDFIKKAKAQDTVVVFLASHGLSDQAGNYYFVPTDATQEDVMKLEASIERGGQTISSKLPSLISWKIYFEALRSVPGKRLLVVDTCQAKRISGTIDMHSLAKRSATSSFALLAASQGNEVSQEYPQGKHGLFTYALLRGFSGEGDMNKDGKISLAELYDFVVQFVEAKRNKLIGKQTPQFIAPKELADMVLVSK